MVLVLDDFTPQFQALVKDPSWLPGNLCLAHGDLNLANIILDDLDNIWFIDWTHASPAPVELDLAKLENDLKFVVSKQFVAEDLPDLLALERLLLAQLQPPPLAQAADRLPRLARDPRFRLLYRAVAAIRRLYTDLHPEQDPTLYLIALLRYALHTLSFDARRGRGECGVEQLRHALGTVQLLVTALAESDFHRLTPAVRPDSYPERQRVPRELAPWTQPCPGYQPPFHEDPTLASSDWADPPSLDWTPPAVPDPLRDGEGRSLNPGGRTGLAGRGRLGHWGANRAVDAVISRRNPEDGRLELLVGRRDDTGEPALPGCMWLAAEQEAAALARCLQLKAGIALPVAAGLRVYAGPVEDYRNTDHAWMESSAWSWHLTGKRARGLCFRGGGGLTELGWRRLGPELVRSLFAGHAELVRRALRHRAALGAPGGRAMQRLLREV
jgi:ADP-ribose pyrophosphatase